MTPSIIIPAVCEGLVAYIGVQQQLVASSERSAPM